MSYKMGDFLIIFYMPLLIAGSGILWQGCKCNFLQKVEPGGGG